MMEEEKMLFSKHHVCPACENNFTSRTVKTGSARFLRTNMDLRPVYQDIEILKYDPIRCPACGYAALESYFGKLTQVQRAQVKERITVGFKKRDDEEKFYTYDNALERYKLCLLSAMVKQAPDSEIGYICLKLAWLLQSKADWLSENSPDKEQEIRSCMTEEINHSKKALEYLERARMQEEYPICSMNEPTLNYLLAALAYKADRLDFAAKTLSYVAASREASERLKDKAYDLRNMITQRKKDGI